MYLSGCISQGLLQSARPDLGIMLQPGMGNATAPLSFWPWAADNGCYAQGAAFGAGDWLEWLASLRGRRERCLFAVAPDVFGDGASTLALGAPYLPTIRQLGFKAALVAQPGAADLPLPWGAFDCLFFGGPDEWQGSERAWGLAREAKRREVWVHKGRVNSLQRLTACRVSLFDSADGTFVRYGPDRNLPRLLDWLDAVNGQGVLEESA